MKTTLVIIGAGGHGKVIADIAVKSNQWSKVLFLDDDSTIQSVGIHEVVGIISDASKYEKNAVFLVAIGDNEIRQKIQSKLELQGLSLAKLIHPNAVIASDVEIGSGSVVMAGVVINSSTHIGKGCIINTSSSIDHDCDLGDYVHISPGAHLAGNIHVGDRTWLGLGSLIINNLRICNDCTVGAGTVVLRNIDETGTYVGVPARKVE
ncbi:MAG: acetyltransferase [Clostridiales bacterium]|nr:acetyltransferase [Clostridiales bacterium]